MRLAALILATLLVVAPAYAHHSGAIFDHDKMITLSAVVYKDDGLTDGLAPCRELALKMVSRLP